jgi:hypothetical protein
MECLHHLGIEGAQQLAAQPLYVRMADGREQSGYVVGFRQYIARGLRTSLGDKFMG